MPPVCHLEGWLVNNSCCLICISLFAALQLGLLDRLSAFCNIYLLHIIASYNIPLLCALYSQTLAQSRLYNHHHRVRCSEQRCEVVSSVPVARAKKKGHSATNPKHHFRNFCSLSHAVCTTLTEDTPRALFLPSFLLHVRFCVLQAAAQQQHKYACIDEYAYCPGISRFLANEHRTTTMASDKTEWLRISAVPFLFAVQSL